MDLPFTEPGTTDVIGPFTLASIETAFRAEFCRELCAEDDLAYWAENNPARGHCGVAALTLNDIVGGELLVARVHRDGEPTGYHWWNRLAGVDVDLTREQFLPGEIVGEPEVIVRPPGLPKLYAEQYLAYRSRVYARLGLPPPSMPEQPQP